METATGSGVERAGAGLLGVLERMDVTERRWRLLLTGDLKKNGLLSRPDAVFPGESARLREVWPTSRGILVVAMPGFFGSGAARAWADIALG